MCTFLDSSDTVTDVLLLQNVKSTVSMEKKKNLLRIVLERQNVKEKSESRTTSQQEETKLRVPQGVVL